jgi:hypothetical protein
MRLAAAAKQRVWKHQDEPGAGKGQIQFWQEQQTFRQLESPQPAAPCPLEHRCRSVLQVGDQQFLGTAAI